ncbi:MAG TPA: hypothetical protein PK131_02330 [Candidatus Woesebacteria bacterium]|nr:hypothetical protein [Candidatus Woesebacteria bacterium]
MSFIFGVLVLGLVAGLMWFLARFFKFDQSVIMDSEYEREIQRIREKIHAGTPEQKRKNRDWMKGLMILAVLFIFSCSGKKLVVLPEPPAFPAFSFVEVENGFLFSDEEIARFRVYMESQKLYREKLLETLERLEK